MPQSSSHFEFEVKSYVHFSDALSGRWSFMGGYTALEMFHRLWSLKRPVNLPLKALHQFVSLYRFGISHMLFLPNSKSFL